MNVSAIIVTRGDHDLTPILDSLPVEWERLVWDNGEPTGFHYRDGNDWRPDGFPGDVTDLAVYGRYAAIEYASGDLIYCQDDDCVLPPESIQKLVAMYEARNANDPRALMACRIDDYQAVSDGNFIVANMPPAFCEQDFYSDHCLVGFGAVFQRDLPDVAFRRAGIVEHPRFGFDFIDTGAAIDIGPGSAEFFRRTCDVVFTALTPRVLVDVPYENLPWADGPDRMYRQDGHVAERTRMLELVRKVHDG